MGNVRNFRRIRNNDTLFLKMCVFRIILVNSWENLQILPLGNVRHFRRIPKNDALSENVRLFHRNQHFLTTFCEILINSEPPGRHLLHIGLLIHGCTLGKIMFFPGTPTMY